MTAPSMPATAQVSHSIDYSSGTRSPGLTDGLGEVIAALQECAALPPASPVPGQLATLCARLNVTGHGITTPPASALPEPWLSVLTQYLHREAGTAPAHDGYAAAAVVLPDLDGIQLMILGLHNCQDSTIMHMHASGPACHAIYGAGRTLFRAADMDTRQWRPLARHPHQRPERNGRRNRAAPGNSAAAEPRYDLDRSAGDRAISAGPRQTPAPLANTLAHATGTSCYVPRGATAGRTTEQPLGGYSRGCYLPVDHALRSASGADVQARRRRECRRGFSWPREAGSRSRHSRPCRQVLNGPGIPLHGMLSGADGSQAPPGLAGPPELPGLPAIADPRRTGHCGTERSCVRAFTIDRPRFVTAGDPPARPGGKPVPGGQAGGGSCGQHREPPRPPTGKRGRAPGDGPGGSARSRPR